jgi:nitrogen fixation protein NifU and related proteins
MNELRELYQEVILDHNSQPRNYRVLEPASHQANGFNPLCGDRVTLYLDVKDNVIRDISFQGNGCAISTASASMLTETLKGKTLAEAQQIFEAFRAMATGTEEPDEDVLDKLTVLAGVREFPSRVKCATLVWHTLQAALNQQDKPAITE